MTRPQKVSAGGRLAGCRALITGGLGGIGIATAEVFLREGAQVWLADLAGEASADVGSIRCRLGSADYIRLDVTEPKDWIAASNVLGDRLDILVNNAGIAPTGEIGILAESDWQRVFAVNSTSAFLALTHLSPLLARAGRLNGRWASVINISSILANVGMGQASAYAASKGALRSFTKSVAIEFAHGGKPIRVNSLHPGFTMTDMTASGSSAMSETGGLLDVLAAETPMGRIADPIEIANAVLFLASAESSFMTGSELTVDGGWTAR